MHDPYPGLNCIINVYLLYMFIKERDLFVHRYKSVAVYFD